MCTHKKSGLEQCTQASMTRCNRPNFLTSEGMQSINDSITSMLVKSDNCGLALGSKLLALTSQTRTRSSSVPGTRPLQQRAPKTKCNESAEDHAGRGKLGVVRHKWSQWRAEVPALQIRSRAREKMQPLRLRGAHGKV
jgi:hypothetical protein